MLTVVYFSGLWLLFHDLQLYYDAVAYGIDLILLYIIDKYIYTDCRNTFVVAPEQIELEIDWMVSVL